MASFDSPSSFVHDHMYHIIVSEQSICATRGSKSSIDCMDGEQNPFWVDIRLPLGVEDLEERNYTLIFRLKYYNGNTPTMDGSINTMFPHSFRGLDSVLQKRDTNTKLVYTIWRLLLIFQHKKQWLVVDC